MIFKTFDGEHAKQTYSGFKRFRFSAKKAIPRAIAVVSIDGGEDVWEIDTKDIAAAAEELQRYYRSEHNIETDVLIYDQSHLFLHDELDPLLED